MQKVYKAGDYLIAFLVMLGCALFILYPVNDYASVLLFELCFEYFFLLFTPCRLVINFNMILNPR